MHGLSFEPGSPHWNIGTSLDDVTGRIKDFDCCFGQPLVQYGLVINQVPGGPGPLFVIRMHHAVFDGWSYESLLDDIEQLYNGQPVPPRESMNRLLHYNRRLNREAADAFWKMAFDGFQGPIFPAPSPGWARPVSAVAKIREVSVNPVSKAEYTMASVIQLAWAILVSSRTGSNDVVFGITVSGRNAPVPGIDQLMGPAIATLPIRIILDMHSTIEDTLKKIQNWATSTIPFEQTGLTCIGQSSPEAAVACQFQTLLVVQPSRLRRESHLLIPLPQNRDQQRGFLSHILTIVAELQENKIHVEAVFDQTVLHPQEIDHMLDQLEEIIHLILDRPSASLHNFRSYTRGDRDQIRQWNKRTNIKPSLVHDTIQNWLVSQPDALAISAWDGCLTYRELLEHAHHLAGYLQARWSMHKGIVAICMERSKWQIVAMVGVLLAGSAFMVLEPELPKERLREMCWITNAELAIACPVTSERAQFLGVDRIFTFTTELLISCDQGYSWVPPRRDPHTPMYVAFTSGSAGSPKGVTVEHAMCHASAQAYQETFGLSSSSRVLYNPSASSDLLIIQTIWTLVAGGCICIPSEANSLSDLAEIIKDLKPNCVALTPAVARMLSPTELPSLDTVVLVGEGVCPSDIDKWAHELSVRVVYALTECTVASAARELLPSNRHEPNNIGRCLNGRSWVVDPDNYHRLLPIGATGELLLSGPMVSRGYLHMPEESQASFVHCPAWASDFDIPKWERFYKTGDLVRYSLDGTILYLGRRDTQVKLNGHRIDLYEIEKSATSLSVDKVALASLMEFNGLSGLQLVLFLAPITTGSKQPGLFQEMDDETQLLVQNLYTYLYKFLPPYMVPSLVIPLSRLPLTPTGKADRSLLQEEASKLGVELLVSYSRALHTKPAPSTGMERILRQIFADVLSIPEDSIHVDQSFLDIGGDSLSAMRVLASSRKHGLSITMNDLLGQRSIAVLSDQLDAQRSLPSHKTRSADEDCTDTR
ncbi:hypothetical protein ABOM_004636, partial [Aspergillus bombycis]